MIQAPILERASRELVVDAGRPPVSPQGVPLKGAGWKEPLVQLFAAAAQRLVLASPMIAQLPQRLLARGVLAVVGHIDRAFAYGFQNPLGTPQPQLLRDPLVRLMSASRWGTPSTRSM